MFGSLVLTSSESLDIALDGDSSSNALVRDERGIDNRSGRELLQQYSAGPPIRNTFFERVSNYSSSPPLSKDFYAGVNIAPTAYAQFLRAFSSSLSKI